jgi:preprotein translocase SecE subunit
VARDRKRAKQRRARRGRGDAPTAPGGPAGDSTGPEAGAEPTVGGTPVEPAAGSTGDQDGQAQGDRSRGAGSPGAGRIERADLPGALEHAGDVDEFDAALVRGAGGVPVDAGDDAAADAGGAAADPEHLSEREIEDEAEAEGDLSEDEIQEIAGSPSGSGGGGGIATPEQASGAPQRGGNRAIGFLRASWAELQRVQWPDRRQVFQATAVVLGFVAIAGAYLGLADYVAKEVVEFILS